MADASYTFKKKCILKYKDRTNLLNGRNEFIFKCLHENKFLIG